jgi:PAS domain S-box-containing protein
LLLMSHDAATRRHPTPIGWTVPDNYENVRKLLQEWRLPPYEEYGKVTLSEAIRQHWVTSTLAFAVFMALSVVAFLTLNIKQRRAEYTILKEAKQKLDLIHAMIVASPDAIFIKDRHGRYVFVNPEAAYIIGRSTEDIIGKDDTELLPPDVAHAMMDDDSTIMSGAGSLTYEEHIALTNDDSRYMLVTKGPMYDTSGEVDGMFGVARDITDLKLLQQEISEKVVQLEAALEKVRQLEGIIPICSYCKKIRDDEKSWHQMENYISSHSEAKFSHGICPECYERELLEIKSMTA